MTITIFTRTMSGSIDIRLLSRRVLAEHPAGSVSIRSPLSGHLPVRLSRSLAATGYLLSLVINNFGRIKIPIFFYLVPNGYTK